MRPYFERDGVTIYCGDAREILPSITLDRGVLLTDPVYGIDGGRGGDARAFKKGRYAASFEDTEEYVRTVCVPIVDALIQRTIRGAVTPGTRCLSFYPRPADIGCFWTPAAATHGPWGMVTFNPILFYGKDYRAGKGAWPTGRQVTEAAVRNGHPCPKPERAWRWLAAKVAEPGDVLIDPFLGSGTTTRVALDLGLQAIGIEIEERYAEIAARRLDQLVLPLEAS